MHFGYNTGDYVFHDAPADRSFTESLIERAQWLERAGFEWFSLVDHFWHRAGGEFHDGPFLECYTGLSAIAQATETIELSALVTCVHYRNPALLAKTVASLDHLSGGRATLGIGAGWCEVEYDAVGIDFPPADVRVRQTRDAIRLCRAAWNEPSPVEYAGEYYDLDGFYLDPKPTDVPVLVGGGGEQLTLRLAADEADRWNVPMCDPETYAHKLEVLREHCAELGTDYDAIEKTVTMPACIRETTTAAQEAFETIQHEIGDGPPGSEDFRGAVGSASDVVALCERYRELGVELLQINPAGNDRETVERFVDDVMPAFR